MKVDKEQHVCVSIHLFPNQHCRHTGAPWSSETGTRFCPCCAGCKSPAANCWKLYIRTTEYGYVVFANLYLLLSPSQNGTVDFAQSWDPRVLLVMHRSNQSNTSSKQLCSSTVLQRIAFSLWNCAGRCPEVNLSNQILSTIFWTYSAKWIERKCLGLKHN